MSSAAASGAFQPLLGDIKEYLDWNRWMILGLTLWALLVAIVIGSSSNAATLQIPCAGANVTATTLECTCQYPFPGVVWVAGLVIMGGVVVMETFTDCMNSDKTKRKGIYPREKNASEMMVGVEDVVTVEAVPAVLHVCQSQRGAMLHAALQVIPHGMTKDELQELVNNISTTLSTPEFKRMVEERTKSEATYTKFSVVTLLKPSTVLDIGVLSVVQTGVLAALHAVHEYISTAVAVALEGGRGAENDQEMKPKAEAEKANLLLGAKTRVPITPGASALAKAMIEVIPDDTVMNRVQATVQTAVVTRISVVVAEMVDVGWFTITYRLVTNLLIFYTIIALTSYNWFPIGKGCFVSWQSENQKAFTLLGIGFLSVILIGIRTTVFDLVDISPKPTAK